MSQFREELSKVIYGGNAIDPFEGFPADEYQLDVSGGGATPIFEYLFNTLKPQFVIEAGSWKGMSALWMANWMRTNHVEGTILCIDTWLGCAELYQVEASDVWGVQGKRKYGRPLIYEQFLANVIKTELQGYILPYPTTSSAAARWLLMKGYAGKADLIYIDAAHDEPDVLRDLIDYWELLKPGGAMFGDDFEQNWPGVAKAVERFASIRKLSLEIIAGERKWVMWKCPVQPSPTSGCGNAQVGTGISGGSGIGTACENGVLS